MLFALLLLAAPLASLPVKANGAVQEVVPMDDRRFWDIIERSARNARDQAQQEAGLRNILAALSLADLVTWRAAYDAKRAAAYSWELWGAAHAIHGGASDDGFDHFRDWLISRGQRVFEAALADPDSLVTAIPAGANEAVAFEGFGDVVIEVWAARTDRDPATMPASRAQPPEPIGKPLSEDPKILAARYPKLWKRFGSAPLE
ncbi:DUF4240 domain-containing protein [Sphingomonas sp. HF-S4]|uniref:DUF4240 domain-containing protein n=1 Tax=Sphingomonas agrestis TaxID=3080540 RepID=A0ABU3YBH1_9SPHN|nr:DUF4240 domain-containing protein [Sphingomonas sp. HF-S4]MDV3458743.1 DUF4240 domain-containing protein [Sphingomonas sp. HF-S4]